LCNECFVDSGEIVRPLLPGIKESEMKDVKFAFKKNEVPVQIRKSPDDREKTYDVVVLAIQIITCSMQMKMCITKITFVSSC
jgi:hypothetical protein